MTWETGNGLRRPLARLGRYLFWRCFEGGPHKHVHGAVGVVAAVESVYNHALDGVDGLLLLRGPRPLPPTVVHRFDLIKGSANRGTWPDLSLPW